MAGINGKAIDVALIVKDKILGYSLEKALKVLDQRVKVFEISDFEKGNILAKPSEITQIMSTIKNIKIS